MYRTLPLVLVLAVALTTLCGCAGSRTEQPANARSPVELYDGQPAAVHATEYPAESATDGIHRGDLAWREGNVDLALFMYVQALQFEPNDAATLRKIGAIHERRNNRPLARKAFELALEREPEHAATLERLGLIYLHQEHYDNAQTLLTRAIAIEPTRWRSHNGLGVLADRRGQYETALAHYALAVSAEPKAGVVYNNRGYSKFLANDLEGAERDLREAIRLGVADRAWLNLGKVQAKARQYGMAFRSFLELLEPAQAYNEVGEAAIRNGDHQTAKTYLESATNESPIYYEQAFKNLAVVNEELKSIVPLGGS
jgi:Flp pilus assembly protein TadD